MIPIPKNLCFTVQHKRLLSGGLADVCKTCTSIKKILCKLHITFAFLLVGHTANYCVVVAQLYTKGECHGIHPFIVQLRDEETHEPMPGITIGEIGTKLGMNATNNGFLGFNKVRIPREQMLMKNAQVLEVSIILIQQEYKRTLMYKRFLKTIF